MTLVFDYEGPTLYGLWIQNVTGLSTVIDAQLLCVVVMRELANEFSISTYCTYGLPYVLRARLPTTTREKKFIIRVKHT